MIDHAPSRHPVDKERWLRVRANLVRYKDVHDVAPFLLMSECWSGIRAYYGSNRRALFEIARYQLWAWWTLQIWLGLLLCISDWVGWTKLTKIPDTDEIIGHTQRHGWKCSGSPNCENIDCIEQSVPRWFKIITRWHAP